MWEMLAKPASTGKAKCGVAYLQSDLLVVVL